jgi:hypothetical protein
VVAHYDRLKELHELLDEMDYSDDGGIVVQSWHIERSINENADSLANGVLSAYEQRARNENIEVFRIATFLYITTCNNNASRSFFL